MATFNGEPDLVVRLNPPVGMLRHFKFDNKGLFSTDNPRLIQRCAAHFKDVEPKNEPKQTKKSTSKEQPIVETTGFSCKKCDHVAESRPKLMAHYKKDHPKEG